MYELIMTLVVFNGSSTTAISPNYRSLNTCQSAGKQWVETVTPEVTYLGSPTGYNGRQVTMYRAKPVFTCVLKQ
jgi:hypothetical protein